MALVAVGCGTDGGSEFIQSDVNHFPVQESRIAESLDIEFRTGFGESDSVEKSVVYQESGEGDSPEEAPDIVAEVGKRKEVKGFEHQELSVALESTEDYAAESAIGLIVPDTSERYHQASEIAADTSQEVDTLALEDRTRDNTVRLVVDSITFNDCVMRGEVHNYSEDQYARNVTVTISALDGEESVQWLWPLTMNPNESAPFEVRIDWPPHKYDFERWNSAESLWEPFANTSIEIAADLSPYADTKRAFVIDYDATERENIWQQGRHSYPIYDERILELEQFKYVLWGHYANYGSGASKQEFATIFPDDLVSSVDVEPVSAQFIPYNYTDVYYVPSVLYPDIYEEGEDDVVSDVRVYQMYKIGSRVVDVWELFPHSVVEQVTAQHVVADRQFIPVTSFANNNLALNEFAYLRLLDPNHVHLLNFPELNAEGWDGTHREVFSLRSYEMLYDDLWIGGVSHNSVNSTIDPLESPPSSLEKTCYAPGALSTSNFSLSLSARGAIEEDVIPYGYKAGFTGGFEVDLGVKSEDEDAADGIYVKLETVTFDANMIRGLIYNRSSKSIARDVIVSAKDEDSGALIGTWRWPLSVQPGELAPFEIPYSDSDLSVGQLEFQVSATLSEHVDSTRSFWIIIYAHGTVYGQNVRNLYETSRFDPGRKIRPGAYLDNNAMWSRPDIRYTKEEFLELYEGVILPDDVDGLELFEFTDWYARLEPPDTHPELAKIVTTQFINDLRAYTAILGPDLKVVDVKEVQLFTSVYGRANIDERYVGVDTIPAPNRWAPNAARLLQIIPYADEADMNAGYYSQVWIGGATEAVG